MSHRSTVTFVAVLRAALGASLVLLTACSSGPPAPVEQRTEPRADARTRPAPPATGVAPAAPPPGAATAPATGPRSAPIRSAGVEVRPLDRPAGAAGSAAAPSSALRTQPKAAKRPYSPERLAEMRAAGQAAPVAAPATVPAAEAPRAADAGAAAKPDAKDDTKPDAKTDAKTDGKPDAKTDSSASFDWPARGRVIQGFAEPRSMGIAIAGSPGDPVTAAADGKVIFSGPGPRGYGNLLIVKHDAETLTVYAHNRALLVKDGQSVKRGQKIAELGDSGTDRPKLHFEVRKSGRPVDPQKLLPPR